MIKHIIKEKNNVWILIVYISVLVLINSFLINKFSINNFFEESVFFSFGMVAKILVVLLPFIVIEEKIEYRSKWSKRLIRIIAVFLTSLAYIWFLDSIIFYCNYFILWLAFGKKNEKLVTETN